MFARVLATTDIQHTHTNTIWKYKTDQFLGTEAAKRSHNTFP